MNGPEPLRAAKAAPGALPAGDATRRHLRGSSLLLGGRGLALAVNFAAGVLAVRYLSKSDWGAFAYALSLVSAGAAVNLLGLQRAVNRFVPLYHERGDRGSMFGALVIAVSSIALLGIGLFLAALGLRGMVTAAGSSDALAFNLLLILAALCPLDALDTLLQGVLAAFARSRAIFFRRYVLAPGLKLAAVLLVLLVRGNVHLLAASYLAAGIAGVAVHVLLLRRLLREQGLLAGLDRRSLRFPVREIFGFALPLVTRDVAAVLKTTVAVVVLERFRGSTEVAELRAVLPVAGLNLVVLQSLKFLFTPLATRLFARNDAAGLNDLYWRSAWWVTVVTFPVFALCFFLAEPLTVFLFGDRYAGAGRLLAVLAAGNYFSAALGLNAYALEVYARVRFISLGTAGALLVGLLLNLCLVPSHGALGAAMATAGAVVVQNVLNHLGLGWRTDIRLLEWSRWKVYLTVVAALAALVLARVLLEPPPLVTAALVAGASLLLVRVNRRSLKVEDTFPELARVPVLRRLLSLRAPRSIETS